MALRRGVWLVIILLAARRPGVRGRPAPDLRRDGARAAGGHPLHARAPSRRRHAGDGAGRRLRIVHRVAADGAIHRRRRCARRRSTARISSVIIKPTGEAALWGKIQEVRDAILDFRRSGKPIVAFMEYGGEQEFYLSTACDKIFLMPSASLDLTGMASYELFLRGMLDKIGAYPDALHIGDYKTASNTFTEHTYHAGASRDGGVAQHRPLRAAGPRHRRRAA